MKKVVYHFGSLAGWPFILSQGMRKRDIESINVVSDIMDGGATGLQGIKANRQLKFDEFINHTSYGRIRKLWNRIRLVLKMIRTARLVHYHGGTILPFNLDAWLFKIFKVPTVISWGGGDARLTDIALANNPYSYRYLEPSRDEQIRKKLRRLSKFGVVPASDPEMELYMKGYFDEFHKFCAPIDLSELTCSYPAKDLKKITFLHIPTHPFVKGTVHIENAFKRLKQQGYEFESLMILPTLTQAEVRKKISECDVYVDELRVGSYGYTAIEAAGSGKPTMTYIMDKLLPQFPKDLPFINTHADNIYENLKHLIENPQTLHDLGVKSRRFVEANHKDSLVIDDLLNLYKKIGMS
jgi:glycosyltransferase involved in cell wall biosynthesis